MQTKNLVEGLAWFFIAALFSMYLLLAMAAAEGVHNAEQNFVLA